MSGPAVRSGSRGGPGRAPSAFRRTPGQRRSSAAARPVCGPEGKGKGHGDVEGDQVRARGRPRPAGASEREGEGGRGDPARPCPECRLLPDAPAPVLFAPAAAEGLSGGWGGDTGGAGGRAGARTGAARGNGRGAEGPRRALFTSRRQSSPGGRAAGGSASRAAVSVAVGPALRRPGEHDRLYPAVLLFSLSGSPLPPPALPGPRGSGAAIVICVCNKTTKKPRGSSERPGPVPASWVPCRRSWPWGTSARVSWALRAPWYRLCPTRGAAGPTQGSSGTFSLCQQRTEK